MKRPMVAFLTQLLLAIRSRIIRRARLGAENLILRSRDRERVLGGHDGCADG